MWGRRWAHLVLSPVKRGTIKPFAPSLSTSSSSSRPRGPQDGVDPADDLDADGFRTLEIMPKKEERRVRREAPFFKTQVAPPRYKRMPADQHWPSVWPSSRSFHPATVPLPLHMGYIDGGPQKRAPPGKFANTELMKIPNFLHLTPPAIKSHCKALFKFCTPWPAGLETDEDCEKHFPVEMETSDYVHAAPTLRDARARVATLRIKMSRLELDYHAKDKLKRILGDKYDPETDMITIVADRCPLKGQNMDYTYYLLTACFFESWKTEDWEKDKKQSDWESYVWEKSPSKSSLVSYLKKVSPEDVKDEKNLLENEEVQHYSKAVTQLFDEGENQQTIEEYKKTVVDILFKH